MSGNKQINSLEQLNMMLATQINRTVISTINGQIKQFSIHVSNFVVAKHEDAKWYEHESNYLK